jgi:hypothetical protein
MPFTRMPCGAPSFDSTFISAMPAARDTAVGAPFARGAFAPELSTLIIRPHFRSFIPGQHNRVSRIAANSLRSRSSCQTSSVIFSDGIARDMPALLTRMSTLPNARITSAKVFSMSAALDTSHWNVSTRPCAVLDALALASARPSGLRARIATCAPDAANSVAMAKPKPLLAPVMMATRPSRRTSIGFPPMFG